MTFYDTCQYVSVLVYGFTFLRYFSVFFCSIVFFQFLFLRYLFYFCRIPAGWVFILWYFCRVF